MGIIHMNGRIYDPVLGRFLQADPFVQAPKNGQSLNRYSYVFNNPLSYTDPSGYTAGDLRYVLGPWGLSYSYGYNRYFGAGGGARSASNGVDRSVFDPGRDVNRNLPPGILPGAIGNRAGVESELFTDNSVTGATIGGTWSEQTGEKFANGAITGTFVSAFGSMRREEDIAAGGRNLTPHQARAALQRIRDQLGVDPAVLVEGENGEVLYSPVDVAKIYKALDRLATAQDMDFLRDPIFGPERTMLARVALGKGDKHTVGWFHHESAEAAALASSSHLTGDAYVSSQQEAHVATFRAQGNTSYDIYHPSVVRAYYEQFGPKYPRY